MIVQTCRRGLTWTVLRENNMKRGYKKSVLKGKECWKRSKVQDWNLKKKNMMAKFSQQMAKLSKKKGKPTGA